MVSLGGGNYSETLNPTTANVAITGSVTPTNASGLLTFDLDGTSAGNVIWEISWPAMARELFS